MQSASRRKRGCQGRLIARQPGRGMVKSHQTFKGCYSHVVCYSSRRGAMKRRARARFLLFSLISLLLCALALGIALSPTTATRALHAAAASAPTGLHVVGNQIEDGSG